MTGDYVSNDVMSASSQHTTENSSDVTSAAPHTALNGSAPTVLENASQLTAPQHMVSSFPESTSTMTAGDKTLPESVTGGRRKKAQPMRLNQDSPQLTHTHHTGSEDCSPRAAAMDYEDSDDLGEEFEPPVPLAELQQEAGEDSKLYGAALSQQDPSTGTPFLPNTKLLQEAEAAASLSRAPATSSAEEPTASSLRDIIISTKPIEDSQSDNSARLPLNRPLSLEHVSTASSNPSTVTSGAPHVAPPSVTLPNFSDFGKIPFLSMMSGVPPGMFPGLPISNTLPARPEGSQIACTEGIAVNGSSPGGTANGLSQNDTKMDAEEDIASTLASRPCPHCGKLFQRDKNLERHLFEDHQISAPVSSAHRGYSCALCPYTTSHYSNLYVHMRVHTGEKPYYCGACGHRSSQGSTLKMHIKTRHSGNVKDYYNLDGNARIRLAHLGKRPLDGVELMAPILNGRIVTDPKLLDPEQGQLAEAKCGKAAASKNNTPSRSVPPASMAFPGAGLPRMPMQFNGLPPLPMIPPPGLPIQNQTLPQLNSHLNPFQHAFPVTCSSSAPASTKTESQATTSPLNLKTEPAVESHPAVEPTVVSSAESKFSVPSIPGMPPVLPPPSAAALSAALLAATPRLPLPWGGLPTGLAPQAAAAAAAVAGLMPLMNPQLAAMQRLPFHSTLPQVNGNVKQEPVKTETSEDRSARKRHESLDSQAHSHTSGSSRSAVPELHSPCSDSDCTHASDAVKARRDLTALSEQLQELSEQLERLKSEKDGCHSALNRLRANVLTLIRVLMPNLAASYPGLGSSDPRVDKALECILGTLPKEALETN